MEKSVHTAVDENVNKSHSCSLVNTKDVTFSILFAINSLIIAALAMTYGVAALSDPQPDKKTIDSDGQESSDGSSHRGDAMVWLGGICLVTVVASILSLLFVYVISTLTATSISCTLYTVLGFTGACAVFLLVVGNVVGGLLALVLLIMAFVFYFMVKDRIAFAAINMKTAGVAITAMPSTLLYAYGVMVAAIAWVFVWTLAVYGVATNEAATHIYHNGETYNIEECTTYTYSGTVVLAEMSITCGSDSCRACVCDDSTGASELVKTHGCFSSQFDVGVYIGMLLSVMWAVSVFTNVVHCTTSGAVASWWFNASATPNSSVVQYSFIRAATTSFGPICLGSLLGAAVGVTRFTIRYMKSTTSCSTRNGICRPGATGYLLACLDSLLNMFEKAVKYFNRYAYCYVAIYGDGFVEASKCVYKLFRSRGLSAVINDGLIDTSMRFAQAVIGMLCLVVSHWYSYAANLDYASRATLSAIALAQGYFLSAITLKVFSAAVTTIYVCYAEDPQAFQGSHPELYMPLHDAWQKIYPVNAAEIDDQEAEDEEEKLLGGEGRKSGYVPPSVGSASNSSSSSAVGPSWYYTSLPTAGEQAESDDPKTFDGWDSKSGSKNKKGTKKAEAQRDIENAVVTAALANPEATAAVASGLVSAAVANPELLSAAFGFATKQQSDAKK